MARAIKRAIRVPQLIDEKILEIANNEYEGNYTMAILKLVYKALGIRTP